MPGLLNRSYEPPYAGPAFINCPPASALPMPKSFLRSSNGSGARRNAEGPGDGDGDEAVAVTSDKSREGNGAISETEEQDGPVDAKPEATSTASHQGDTACEDQTQRTNDNDEDNGMNRQLLSEDVELQRRQQVIIDDFEAQTATIQAAPPPQTTTAPRDHQQFTIPANVLRAAQAMQLGWLEQQIQTTGQLAAKYLVALDQSTNELLQLCKRRLALVLARQAELRLWRRLDEIDEEIERGPIPAEENEELRWTGDSDSNGINENGVAGIEAESDLVASTAQMTMQESEETTGGNGTVPPEVTDDGEEAEGAECLMEIGAIDDDYSYCMI